MKLNKKYLFGFFLGIVFFLAFAIAGCSSTTNVVDKSGAQLWGETCSRCHSMRPPQSLTDAEWDVVGLHMRTRANLSGKETAKIIEFLKMAN